MLKCFWSTYSTLQFSAGLFGKETPGFKMFEMVSLVDLSKWQSQIRIKTPKNTLRFCCGAAHRNALIFFFFPLFAAKVMRYSCNELFSGVFFFKPESLLTQLYIPFFPQLNTIIAFYVTVHIFFSIFFYPHCFFSSRKPKQNQNLNLTWIISPHHFCTKVLIHNTAVYYVPCQDVKLIFLNM